MLIPKFNDLTKCSFCKSQFRIQKYNSTKRCVCSTYVYWGEDIHSISRSIQHNKDVYILVCIFEASLKDEKQPPKEKQIFYCEFKMFIDGNPSPVKIDVPNSMLSKIPLLEDAKKVIRFCDLIRLLS